LVREVRSSKRARQFDAVDLAAATAARVTERHPELSSLAMQLAFSFKRASAFLVQQEESRFASTSSRTVAAVRVLTMIWMFEPVEARDIAVLSGSSRQAVSGVLLTLERDELITRERGVNSDRRLAPVSITEKGRALLDAILPQQNEADVEFFSALNEQDQAQLIALTDKLLSAAMHMPHNGAE
jgi:DNA-binding MarR family transcriptional regulator